MIDVFIAGAQKAGTTSVLKYLGDAPEVAIHPQIEMTYFYVDEEFKKGEKILSEHYKLPNDGNKICVAKHATMTRSNKALKRLQGHNPNCKIIFCTREPVQRAFSSYLMEKRGGSISESFDVVIRIAMEQKTNHWYYNVIVELGCYQNHIDRILKYFPKDQLKVVRLEDLVNNLTDTKADVKKWTGSSPNSGDEDSKSYNSKSEVSFSTIQRMGGNFPWLKKAFINIVGYEYAMNIARSLMKLLHKGKEVKEKLEDYPVAKATLESYYRINP